jgi:hypothetical protein
MACCISKDSSSSDSRRTENKIEARDSSIYIGTWNNFVEGDERSVQPNTRRGSTSLDFGERRSVPSFQLAPCKVSPFNLKAPGLHSSFLTRLAKKEVKSILGQGDGQALEGTLAASSGSLLHGGDEGGRITQ